MQDMELDTLPVVDWEEGIRLAGHKKELARDLLNMLVEQLPEELKTIHELDQSKNYQEMVKTVHKLHGAVCYTGTPRLKSVLAALETELKTHIMDSPSSLLNQLDAEVNGLFEYISKHNQTLK